MKAASFRELKAKAATFGWTFVPGRRRGYFKAACACGRHLKWVHRTPSDPNYFTNCLMEMHRKCAVKPNTEEEGPTAR